MKLNCYSAEVIAHVKDNEYRKRLEDALTPIYEMVKKDGVFLPEKLNQKKGAITNLVMERFGINLNLDLGFNPLLIAYTMPNPISGNHVFLNEDRRGKSFPKDIKKFVKENTEGEGYYDPVAGRVGGVFSTYLHLLGLDLVMLVNNFGLNVKELCAVFSHEIGHIMTWYEYAWKLDRGNQIILDVIHNLDKEQWKVEEQTFLIHQAVKEGVLDEKEQEAILSAKSKPIFVGRFSAAVLDKSLSQAPNAKYDDTSSEQLADAFSARLGYYKELVSGLEKLYAAGFAFNKQQSKWAKYYFYFMEVYTIQFRANFITYLLWIFFRLILGFAVSIPLIIVAGWVYTIYAVYTENSDVTRVLTYDDLYQRYKRIRMQVVDALKDESITPARKKQLLSKLEAIDKSLKTTNQWEPIITLFIRYINPNAAKVKAGIELEKMTEGLINNELFVLAAQAHTFKQQEDTNDEDD